MRYLIIAAAALLVAAVVWTLVPTVPDPGTLYTGRCGACHTVRDLCTVAPAQRVGLVATMRERHGAGDLISDDEAPILEDYIAGYACKDGS